MLGKTPVALQTLSNSYDKLKKDTDSFLKKFKKFKKSNPDVKESENLLSEECKSLANELESLTKEINLLENKDPKQQKNFESKKKNLLKKVAAQQKLVSEAYDFIVQQTTLKENEESKNVETAEERDTEEKVAAKSGTSKKSEKKTSENGNRSKKGNNNNSSKKDSQSESNISGKSIVGDSEKEINEDISENIDEQDESDDDDDDEDEEEDDDDDDDEEDDDEEEEEEGATSTTGAVSTIGPASSTSIAVTENEDLVKIKSFKSNRRSSKSKSKILNQKSESEKNPTEIVPTSDPHQEQAETTGTESQSSGVSQKKKGLKSKLIADMKSVLNQNLRHKEKLPSKTKELLEEKDEGRKKDPVEEDEEEVEESDEYDDEAEEDLDEEKEDSTNEEDDDDDEEEESDEEMEIPAKYFVALSNYEKEEISDLSFKKGEVLKIVQAHRNGWWLAENNEGNQGLVPSTYLQMKSTTDDDEDEDDDDDDDSSEESRKEEGESDSVDNSEEEEENEEKGDSDIDEGLKVDNGGDQPKTRSAKQLWQTIKESIQEQSIVDVLQAKGTVPSGFRPSTLSSLWIANSEYRMEKALHPSLSKTAMSYTDLFYSPSDKQICPYNVNILKIVNIQSCRNIPQTGPGIDVQCRCIRVCIFDGKNVLSNIHTIKVQSVDKSQKSWNFSSRVSDNMDISLHTEFFIRTNYSGTQISLLFELCLSYIQQDTQEQGVFSCGWTKLLLTEETLTSRTYELPLHGGTPYDRGIPLDSRFPNAVEENSFLSLFTGHQKPMLMVKVLPPKKEQKEVLNSLPVTIIGNVCLMHFYALYRNILAKALLRDRADSDNTELISSSVLASFPLIADQFDMMQLLRDTWIEKQKEISRTARRDINCHKKMFIDSFLETVYPFSHILTSGVPMTGIDTNQRQYDAIQKFKDLKSERGSTLAVLLSDDFTYEPMKLNEVTFSVLKDNESMSEG